MAKKQSDGEAAEAAGKRRPQKKTAAPRPGARSRPAKGGKPPSKPPRPSKPGRSGKTARIPRPTRPPPAPPAQAVLPIGDADLIEDADILSETRVEAAADAVEARPLHGEDFEEAEDVLEEVPGEDEDTNGGPPGARGEEDEEDEEEDDEEEEEEDESAGGVMEEVVEVEDQPPALSPEEQELASVYGDELAKPAIAHAEYTDRQTADEDRPMMPEINARDERKLQWQERRDRRRRRRDERDRQRAERRDQPHHGAPRPAHDTRPDRPELVRGAEPRPGGSSGGRPPGAPQPGASSPAIQLPPSNGEHDALARVGTPLGDAAATVFAQLRNGQPLPVRQLAAMMRKRSLVETDPEQLWPQLKAELLGDERSYRTLGLRPRIVYRGRDLFAPGPVAMSQTADAEASVAAALSRLAGATHRALAARIAKASGQGFERLIHAYLVAAGYRDIAWIKRVGGISYAQTIAPGLDRLVLISARSGDQPIDRRGIGELRVGVEAKDLVAGILFSARELSEDAEHELERAGRSISVMCGDQLVAALISAGVGVVSAAAPLHYVDDQLLDELLAG
jgi:hypothetical protein